MTPTSEMSRALLLGLWGRRAGMLHIAVGQSQTARRSAWWRASGTHAGHLLPLANVSSREAQHFGVAACGRLFSTKFTVDEPASVPSRAHERVRIHFACRLRVPLRASDALAAVVGEGATDIVERGVHGLARCLQSAPLCSDGSGQVERRQPPSQAISSSRAQSDWAGNSVVPGRDEAETFNGSSPHAQGRCSYWGIQRARPLLFQRI